MARYTGPKSKIARKFGEPIFGEDKVLASSAKTKSLPAELTLPVSMVLTEEGNFQSTVLSFAKNKRLNTPMVYLSASSVTSLTRLHALRA